MKKICTLALMLVLLLNTAVVYAQDKTYTLTLEDAIEMALKDSPQFISADTKITDAKKQLEKAKSDRRNLKGVIRLPEGLQQAAVKKGYYVAQAEIGVESAKMEKIQAEKKLAYEITQKYYTLKLSEALCNVMENAYQIALSNKETMDMQYSLGLVAELDVNNAAYSLMKAQATLDSYKRNYDIAKKNLMISLRIDDYSSKLILTDTIEYESFSADLESDIESAMDKRLDLYSLRSVYEQAKRYLEVTGLLGSGSSQYSAANQAMVQSEYTYNNTKKLIGLSINMCYNDILNANDSLILSEKNLNLRRQEYNIAKIQYELGMITNTQLMATYNSVSTAETELENAKLTYKLAVEKYGYETEIGL